MVGCIDTFSKVSGKGIEKLKNAGIEVTTNILEKESRFLNRRFFTYHEKKRPYIILKWAQSADGFIDKCRDEKPSEKGVRITDDICLETSHLWRSQEQAILVGTTTAVCDNPNLTTRLVNGRNPLRLAWDLNGKIPATHNLKDDSTATVIFSNSPQKNTECTEYLQITNPENLLQETLDYLYEKEIQSLIVEGGTKTLQTFIDADLWDEARIFTTEELFHRGVAAPIISSVNPYVERVGNAQLSILRH